MEEREERLDVVSEEGEVLRTLRRSEIHGNPALLHRVVHVLVFDGAGGLLLQKRSMDKDVAPGKWDTSVGGHINSGESLEEALCREMREELGISGCTTVFLYTYIHSNRYERELVYTYACVHEGDVTFNREEIDDVRAWDMESISKALGTGIFSDNFEHEFRTYMKFKGPERFEGIRSGPSGR